MKMKTLLLVTIATLGLTASTMAQNLPNYIPANGLVGWWPFNGNANDESGNNNNGVVNGAILTSDRFGNTNKAYSFNGVNDFIQTQTSGPTGSGITISYWYLSSDLTRNTNVCEWGGNSWGSYFNVCQNDWAANIVGPCYGPTFEIGGSLISRGTSTVPNVLNWHHSVIIIPSSAPDLNSTLIYLDGQLLNGVCSFINYGAPAPNISNLNPIRIGRGWQRDGYYSGTIDDIGIWNRALTQQEITDLYNGNSGITGFNSVTHNNIIKIFPNPANDHLTIDYGNFATMNGYQLKIENSLGQKLFQTNISQQIDYISLNNWGGNGLYFVHVIDAQGNTIDIRKIVLQ